MRPIMALPSSSARMCTSTQTMPKFKSRISRYGRLVAQRLPPQRTSNPSRWVITNCWTGVWQLITLWAGNSPYDHSHVTTQLTAYRLWGETLRVFGPARSTDCFLSVGTGIPANEEIPRPGEITKIVATVEALAGTATNTEIVHILFRTLIDAFAPHPGVKKYWRMNIGTKIEAFDEETGWWPFKKTVHHNDNYKGIGDLDDVKGLPALQQVTKEYIEQNMGMIDECARVLAASLEKEKEKQ